MPETGLLIRNPILRGFNPDPSIVRVGDDYYVATSTFEGSRACRSTIRATSCTGDCCPGR